MAKRSASAPCRAPSRGWRRPSTATPPARRHSRPAAGTLPGSTATILARQTFQPADEFFTRAGRAEAAGDIDAESQLLALTQRQVKVQRVAAGVAVGDARQALGVVEGEELLDGFLPRCGRRLV